MSAKRMSAAAIAGVMAVTAALRAGTVQVSGSDALKQAMRKAAPGTRILLAGGKYQGGLWVGNVHGRPGAPIEVAARDPDNPPVFQGGRMGFELEGCSHVVLDGLVFEKAELNNLQMWRCRYVVVKNCRSRNIRGTGNCDGIKLTAVADFLLYNCTAENWGAEGSAIDMVGCARGLIMKCRFAYPNLKGQTANATQPKCGAFNIGVYRCRFEDASLRAVQFGGGIGPGRINRYDAFGKLKETGYSGVDQVAMGNVIVAGGAAAAYCSVANCTFEHNTIVNPARHVLRILFEGGAEPTANNTFARNLIVYGKLISVANVGPNTKPATFTFARNYWFNRLDPTKSVPKLPAAEKDPAGGADPKLGKDFRPALRGAAAYGAHAAGLEKAWAGHTGKFRWAWRQAKEIEATAVTRPAAAPQSAGTSPP